jgi:hypothetical protein
MCIESQYSGAIVDVQTGIDVLRSDLSERPEGPGVGEEHRPADAFFPAHCGKFVEKADDLMILDNFVGLDVLVNQQVPLLKEQLLNIIDVRELVDPASFKLPFEVAGLIFTVDLLTGRTYLFEYVKRVIVGNLLLGIPPVELAENSIADAFHSILTFFDHQIVMGRVLPNERIHGCDLAFQMDGDTGTLPFILLYGSKVPMSQFQMTDQLQSFLEGKTLAVRTWVVSENRPCLAVLIEEKS